jgi:hypothetical protein
MEGVPMSIWQRSSFCVASGCVEVGQLSNLVVVRDSKENGGPVLRYTREEWGAFLAGVKAGEFDIFLM